MCGIVGCIAKNNLRNILVNALTEMEYRGYDSAGLAYISNNETYLFKETGKLQNLISTLGELNTKDPAIGIAHTRWATHGKVTKNNAHPHKGIHSLIVHNGIIENFNEIKQDLINENILYNSDTDSEVIAHLFEYFFRLYDEDPLLALKSTINKLKGSFAFLVISPKFNNQILFARYNSPLSIGIGEDFTQILSSALAFSKDIKKVYHLKDGDYGYITNNDYKIFNKNNLINVNFIDFELNQTTYTKEQFNSFMEKEILEQNTILHNTIKDRILNDTILFKELPKDFFKDIKRIILCACGTSFHAALIGRYLFERNTKIISNAEIASEFNYRTPVLKKDDLVIFLSQSGETADTITALKQCKTLGIKTLVISNVDNSTLVRESISLLTNSGIERSVASTKAFSSQILVLWLLTLYISQENKIITLDKIQKEISDINEAINACKIDLEFNNYIKDLIYSLRTDYRYIFLGRDIFYPLALEGALKLKEITYISAEGYPAGEMKHGPIAIADTNLCTIALTPVNLLYDKVKSNVIEIASRGSKIINISAFNFNKDFSFIKTLETDSYMVELFRTLVILQLFSLHTATKLKRDVDMPRNLAKSVTVE